MADERIGDILTKVKDADRALKRLNPMRAYDPKGAFPTHPSRLHFRAQVRYRCKLAARITFKNHCNLRAVLCSRHLERLFSCLALYE
ncbi:hypothetical protein [Bacillus swezeyi]|uniref:hypothetical protein n=1 Tax=Bacillus swezeyi TaxID=1925020 RepID=UPI001CA39B70